MAGKKKKANADKNKQANEVKDKEQDQPGNKWADIAAKEEKESEEETARIEAGLSGRSKESLEAELIDLKKQLADRKDLELRMQADLQNMRTRFERDRDNAYKYANEKLVGELLPIVDSLLRGIEAVNSEDPEIVGMREGMEMTLGMLQDVLTKHGVVVINPEPGTPFDPQQHEAMTMQVVEGADSNTVVSVLQPGCELNGRVLRAAMVIVAK